MKSLSLARTFVVQIPIAFVSWLTRASATESGVRAETPGPGTPPIGAAPVSTWGVPAGAIGRAVSHGTAAYEIAATTVKAMRKPTGWILGRGRCARTATAVLRVVSRRVEE